MSTYRDLISGALRLIGVVGEGENPSPYQANNALGTLNEILDSFNADGLKLFEQNFSTLTLTGATTYTIGPGGNISVPVRPTNIDGAWIRVNGHDSPINILTVGEYGNVGSKAHTAASPTSLYLSGSWPAGTLSLHPVPSGGTLVLLFSTPLNSVVTLDTTESLPPAYRQAIRYELAVQLAPEYGREAPATVQLTALRAKNLIAVANTKGSQLEFDVFLRGGWYSIATDEVI